MTQSIGLIRSAQPGLLQVEIDLRVAGKRQVLNVLRFEKYAFVIRDEETYLAGVVDGAQAETFQRGSFGKAGYVGVVITGSV